ncbi:MAG: DUF1295 domain-containing protein [Gammaproteobacteria bacterium]|nr:DUF1295 domain-containing protein [Gammaproteobacteria bacterium]
MLEIYSWALPFIVIMGFITWLYSVKKQNVNSVDSLWSLMFLMAAMVYLFFNNSPEFREWIIFCLVALWSLRLSVHLTLRNWGHEEDRRYRQIRSNNEPGFKFKSLYIIFGLQGFLAWIISIPLLIALSSSTPLSWLDGIAMILWIIGFTFEALGDYQLVAFKRFTMNHNKVLDSGLWAYTRHPNYFGEFCMWWAYFLFAIPAGGWWTVYAPLLMSFLLLKVSGVVMLEKDIGQRRPAYQHYISTTNSFFPWFKKTQQSIPLGDHQS